jgi:hypothetical protein
MLTYALLIFAIAAAGGLIMAARIFRGQFAPWVLSIGHALLGATGLALLATVVLQGAGSARATAALGLLVVAALGGFYLATMHLRKALAPKAVVGLHAGLGVAGVLTLLSVVLAV